MHAAMWRDHEGADHEGSRRVGAERDVRRRRRLRKADDRTAAGGRYKSSVDTPTGRAS